MRDALPFGGAAARISSPGCTARRRRGRVGEEEGVPIEDALCIVTSNAARATGLASKGEIATGKDADLLVLNDDLSIHGVIARGKVMVQDGVPVARGMFDDVLLRELG